MRLEVERARDALLEAVDDRQLAGTLLGTGVGRLELFRSLARPSPRGPATTARCRAPRRPARPACRGGRGRCRGSGRTRRRCPRRGNPASRCCAISGATRHERWSSSSAPSGMVAQACGARAARFVEPAVMIVLQQRLRVFAARARASRRPRGPSGCVQHEQHALGAGEFGDFVDEEFVQLGGAAQFVQAHPRVDESLERRAQVGFAGEMRGASLRREPASSARVRDPRADDVAVRVDLVEIAAAQALVAQACRCLPAANSIRQSRARFAPAAASPFAASAWWRHHHTCAGERPAPIARRSRAR